MARKAALNYFDRTLVLLKSYSIRISFTNLTPLSHISLMFLLACFLVNCDSELRRSDYIKWIQDYQNKIHVRSTISHFIVDLQYQPAEYVLLQRGIENYSGAARAVELKTLSGIQYYTLILSRKDGTDLVNYGVNDPVEKQERLYYFSYRFQDDITLEEDGKILPCVLYHSERPADPNGGRTFVLGFENQNANSALAKVVIRSDLFSTLPIKIEIAKSNIPKLIYD